MSAELTYSITSDYAAARCDADAHSLGGQRSSENERSKMHVKNGWKRNKFERGIVEN
jgi:hypothetical protein